MLKLLKWRQPPPLPQLLLVYLLMVAEVQAKPPLQLVTEQQAAQQLQEQQTQEQLAADQQQQEHLPPDQEQHLPHEHVQPLQLQPIPPEQLHAQPTLQLQPVPPEQQQLHAQQLHFEQLPQEQLHLVPEQVQNQQLQLQNQQLQLQNQQLQQQNLPSEQLQHQQQPFSPNLDGEKFRYSYSVQDPSSGGRSGHLETRNGVFSLGNYYVKMPGATQQTVNYFTDDWGYHPVVAYSTASGSAVTSTHFALGGRAVAALQHQHKLHHRMQKHRQFKEEPIPATVLVAPAAPLPPPPATLVAPAAPLSLSTPPPVNPLLVNSVLPDIGENSLSSLSPPPIAITPSTPISGPEEVLLTSSATSPSPGVSEGDGNIIDDSSFPGASSTIRPIIVAETGVTGEDEISTGPTTPSTLTSVTSDGTDTSTSPTVVITPRPPATSPAPQTGATETFLAPLGAASSLASVSTPPEQSLEKSNHKEDDESLHGASNTTSKPVEKMTEMVIEKSPAIFEAHYHTTVEILKSIPLDAETGQVQTTVEEQERHYGQNSEHMTNLQQVQELQEHAHSQLLKQRAAEQAEFERQLEEQIKDKKAEIEQLYKEMGSEQEKSTENNKEESQESSEETKQAEPQNSAELQQDQSAEQQTPPQAPGESAFGERIKPLHVYMNPPPYPVKLRPVNEAIRRPTEGGAYRLIPVLQLQHPVGGNIPQPETEVRLAPPVEFPPEYSFRQQIQDPVLRKQLGRFALAQKQIEHERRKLNHFDRLHQQHRFEDGGRLQVEEQRADALKQTIRAEREHPLRNDYHLDLQPPPQDISATQAKQASQTEQILQDLQAGRIQPVLIPAGQLQGVFLQRPQQVPLLLAKPQISQQTAEDEYLKQQQIRIEQLQQQQIQAEQIRQQQIQAEHIQHQQIQAEQIQQQQIQAEQIQQQQIQAEQIKQQQIQAEHIQQQQIQAEQIQQQQIQADRIQQQQIQAEQIQQQIQADRIQQQQIQAEQQQIQADRIQHQLQVVQQREADRLKELNVPLQLLPVQETQDQRIESYAEGSEKPQIQVELNPEEIPQPERLVKDDQVTQEPITEIPLIQQIEAALQQHEIQLREQQVQSELLPGNRINLEDLQQQRLETEQTKGPSDQAALQDRTQTSGEITDDTQKPVDSDQQPTQHIEPTGEQIAEETDNHRKAPQFQSAGSVQVAQLHQLISDPQVLQPQLTIVQLQQVPAGTEQLQILSEEHLNAPQPVQLEEHPVPPPPPAGDTNLLQPPAPPVHLNVDADKHLSVPPPLPVAIPLPPPHPIEPSRVHQRHPPPRPTTASYAAQVQRHRETDLSHKAVPGIDFDKQVHCAERVYSYASNGNGGGHPWNRNTRRANLRKLCIEYGGFKPPLVPSTPIEEDGQPVGPPPPPISSHHNID